MTILRTLNFLIYILPTGFNRAYDAMKSKQIEADSLSGIHLYFKTSMIAALIVAFYSFSFLRF